MEVTVNDHDKIVDELMRVIGAEGCGVSCSEATVFRDKEGWKMMLEGFTEPWLLGQTVAEAKTSIREYA